MALEEFTRRRSRRPLDAQARSDFEEQLAIYGPRARFRVRWDWSEDGNVLHVRTTMVRWEIHFGDREEGDLVIFADVPGYIANFFSEKRQLQFREEVERKLTELGF